MFFSEPFELQVYRKLCGYVMVGGGGGRVLLLTLLSVVQSAWGQPGVCVCVCVRGEGCVCVCVCEGGGVEGCACV